MLYLSIDVETTGIDPEKDQILEIGVIIEDTKTKLDFNRIPKFKCIVEHDSYHGSAYAINMNQRIFDILAKIPKQKEAALAYRVSHNILKVNDVHLAFERFLNQYGVPYSFTAAGKNYAGFDSLFLKNIPGWPKAHQRVIDPGPIFIDWTKDFIPPNLSTCKERAGLKDIEITHDALYDAWDVIKVLRTKY